MNIELFYFFLILFCGYLILSELIRPRFLKRSKYSSTSSGSIVMAFGIFFLSASKKLPFDTLLISKLSAIGLLAIWIDIAIPYFIGYLRGYLSIIFQHINDWFGVGTWVAGCAVLTMVFFQVFPSFSILIWIMMLLSLSIWIIYLWIIIKNFWLIYFGSIKSHTGVNLLSTVSIQSIVIVLNLLFSESIPRYITQGLIEMGGVFYVLGLVPIVHYYATIKPQRFFLSMNNTNSIIHGAVSITGLATLTAHAFSNHILILLWILATSLFILVEGIALIKLYLRIKIVGLLKGAFVYNVSQWARNFTYGMYYAFSSALFDNTILQNRLIELIVQYGQFVVLGLLLIEIFLFFRMKLSY